MPAILPANSASRSLNNLAILARMSFQSAKSLRLDSGSADDVAPALRLLLDKRGNFGRRAAAGADAQLLITLQQNRVMHRGIGRRIELGDDVVRSFRRRG